MDLFDLPFGASRDQVRIFRPTGGVTSWQTWIKPPNCVGVFIMCIGGGGAGGAGFGSTAGSARGGGGGGQGACITRALYFADAVPDALYIQVGQGGKGVAGGGGGNGSKSFVCVYPDSTVNNVLLVSEGGAVTGGLVGTGSGGGTGGGGGSSPALGTALYMGRRSIFLTVTADSGTAGGAQTGAAGTAHALSLTTALNGGAGGGGAQSGDFAGGVANGQANSFCASANPAGAAGSFPGSHAFRFYPFPLCQAATGGGASNTTVGGAGGSGVGVPGAGGGGGGAGVTTGGIGGDGGDGIVLIITW